MELWDIYDKDRNRHGVVERGQKFPEGFYSLKVHICIFNSKGQMLIQQRADNKKNFPGIWDMSLGGNVQAGETSGQGATRELLEELGLDIDLTNVRPLLTVNYAGGFCDYYVIEQEVELSKVSFKDHEVKAVKWADCDEVVRLIKEGKFIKYHIPFIQSLFVMREKSGVYNF